MAVLGVVLEVWYTWVIIVTLTSSVLWFPQELTMNLNDQIICSMVLMPTHNSITPFTFDFAPTKWKLPHSDSSAAMQTLLEWTRILQRRGHHP